eukprot:5763132-Amphidinium_carterae.1
MEASSFARRRLVSTDKDSRSRGVTVSSTDCGMMHWGVLRIGVSAVLSSHADLEAPLLDNCNEWRLLHGTTLQAALRSRH